MEKLRRRLQEAEDTINAIREGHVEALVVSGPEGEVPPPVVRDRHDREVDARHSERPPHL